MVSWGFESSIFRQSRQRARKREKLSTGRPYPVGTPGG